MIVSDALYRMESHYFFSPISGFFFWKENKVEQQVELYGNHLR